jgi:cbb3-type cytochrome oxidase subunit 3
MLPLAAGSGIAFAFVVIALAIVLLLVVFRADDRNQAAEEAEAEARRELP